jgi:hypothetical protein
MTETLDIFLRAHTVVLDEPKRPGRDRRRRTKPAKWPELALVFHRASRTDISQELTCGFYRVLKLNGHSYVLEEEGAFFNDELPENEREVLQAYVGAEVPDRTSFPPRFPLHSRSEFVKNVFYRYARKGTLIVGFNICYDLSRIARKWSAGDRDEWSLVLSEFLDGKENLYHPRVLINPIDSKKSFIRFRSEWVPKGGKAYRTDIYKSRFLDLRTLLWALFQKPLSLKAACELQAFKKYDLPKTLDYTPTGQVSVPDIEYARQNARCVAALLNAAKQDFDLHPIQLSPAQAYSPASMVKAYLEEMGIVPPPEKFKVPNEILGIAMEAYMGGRARRRESAMLRCMWFRWISPRTTRPRVYCFG